MRRLRFIPALLLFLSACSENIIEHTPVQGSVSISLSADMRDGSEATKAEAIEPALDDFRVAIYRNSNQMRLYNDSYANTADTVIVLNAGEYRLIAQYGDTLGCGFDKPYYLADQLFEVEGPGAEVSAVAKLANVQIEVLYDETIEGVYPDYYTVVRHSSYSNKKLKFTKNEDRFGYMPGGELELEIWALVDDVWKVFKTEPTLYNPNDYVTFIVTSDDSEGNLLVKITVDSSVDPKDETIMIPAITVPQDAPSITLAGFDGSGNIHEFVEGVDEGANAMASFVARGAIAKAVLTIESEYLAERGVPTEVDFADLTPSDADILRSVGFAWDENMNSSRKLSYIDFSDVIANMLADTRSAKEDVTMARFFLKVEDSVAKTALSSFSIVSGSVKPELTIQDWNVWAAKVVSPVVTLNKGDVNLVKLQASLDQNVWNDIDNVPSQNGYTLTYGTIPAEASTTYYVRSIYNENEACVSPVVTIRTEDALQLGNCGFDEWTEKGYLYDQTIFDTDNNLPWYQPWTSDQWWDTNATVSMRDNITAAYSSFKTFPAVQYSTDSKSGKSAQLIVLNVGDANSTSAWGGTNGDWYVGELFLGRGNDGDNGSWSKVSEGHAFASRPSAISFWYEYVPYSSDDTFGFDVTVKAADGTVLAQKSQKGKAASEWTQMTVDIPYSVIDKKAASILVSFRASTSSSHSCANGGDYLEVAGSRPEGDAARIKLSATLRVDDVQLHY